MTAPIEASWGRVIAWLDGAAPASFARLSPGASDAAIAEAESALGLVFPTDLKTLLALNDGAQESFGADFEQGARFLLGDHRLLSTIEVVEQTLMLRTILGTFDEEMVGRWWHPEWVCFASHIAADGLAIDVREGPAHGAVGEFLHEGLTVFDWGPSLAAVIENLADCLDAGGDFRQFRPEVDDGCLGWDVIEHPDS